MSRKTNFRKNTINALHSQGYINWPMNNGLVIKSTGSWYIVSDKDCKIHCRIKGIFRTQDIVTTSPVTVGDRVDYELNEDGTGLITRIETRKNYIIRRSPHFNKEAQLLAANIDRVFLMVSLKHPASPFEFIDRFLVTAEAYHIESIILINKIDLLDTADSLKLKEFIKSYGSAGYKCIELSVTQNLNVEKVYAAMKGRLSLLAGNSGVGKSTFINAVAPSLNLKTDTISDFHQTGKHSTTFSEIFQLDKDTYVIDSPGIKGFGLIDMKKEEIGLYFPEIFKVSKDCKFYNCTHLHEPGCAVAEAVKNNLIGSSRYKSYCNIVTEKESKYR